MFDCVKSAFRNLGRKKFRTGLTILGIAIGVASVIMISNISQYGTTSITAELDSLGLGGLSITTNAQASATLTEEELEIVRKSAQVDQAMPVMMRNTKVYCKSSEEEALVWGIDSKANKVISLQVLYGRAISNADVNAQSNVCMVDQTFAQNIYQRENIVGKKISILCGGVVEEFEVVGVIKTGSGLLQSLIGDYIPNFVYVPYSTLQRATGSQQFDQIAVRVEKDSNVDQVGENIVARLERANGISGSYVSSNLVKQREGLDNMLNIVTMVLSAVGAISLLVASLSIMTVMLVSVNERTREIGIKKSIGAKKSMILVEFLLEAVCLSFVGCLAGILIGNGISLIGAHYLGITLTIQGDIIALTTAFSMVTGMIFGVYPAMKACKLHPVDALRND